MFSAEAMISSSFYCSTVHKAKTFFGKAKLQGHVLLFWMNNSIKKGHKTVNMSLERFLPPSSYSSPARKKNLYWEK